MVIVMIIVKTSKRRALPTNRDGPLSVMSSHRKKHKIMAASPAAAVNSAYTCRGHRGNKPPKTSKTMAAPNNTIIGLSANQLIEGPTKSRSGRSRLGSRGLRFDVVPFVADVLDQPLHARLDAVQH